MTKKTVLITDLSATLKREMYDLFELYYDHVEFDRFLEDLNEKTHVFLFFQAGTDRLVGFSTIFRRTIPEISPGTFLFSGDTVIHEDFWGSKILQKAFFWFILESKLLTPLSPLYWMLMSKGVKTYLMMRKNFYHSYPNHKGPTPEPFRSVCESFYRLKFSEAFDPARGLILFKEKMGSVKSGAISPPGQSLQDPDTKFYYKVNPNHHEGDELACITEIRFSDFVGHVPKFFLPKKAKR